MRIPILLQMSLLWLREFSNVIPAKMMAFYSFNDNVLLMYSNIKWYRLFVINPAQFPQCNLWCRRSPYLQAFSCVQVEYYIYCCLFFDGVALISFFLMSQHPPPIPKLPPPFELTIPLYKYLKNGFEALKQGFLIYYTMFLFNTITIIPKNNI